MKETFLMDHVNFWQGMLIMFFIAYIFLPAGKRINSGADKRGRFFERGICPAHHGFRLCTSYFILCFMLMIPLLITGMVHAEQPDNVASVTAGESTTYYPTLQAALNAAADGGTVTLLTDIDTEAEAGSWPLSADSGNSITLDLDGKTVSAALNNAVIKISNNASLTLTDGSKDKSGKVINAGSNGNARGVVVDGGIFTVNGGTIKSTAGKAAGTWGVELNAGTFTMDGGTITGWGTGVNLNDYDAFIAVNTVTEVFDMKGGSIEGNTTGVYAVSMMGAWDGTSYAVFNMTGGTITGNISEDENSGLGGGVWIDGGAEFNMTDGTISGNTWAKGSGAGVGVRGGIFNLSGGTITDNTAAKGGGIYVGKGYYGDKSKLNLKGSPDISGNSGGNVYLDLDNQNVLYKITIVGGLNPKNPIGIKLGTADGTGLFTDSSDVTNNNKEVFFSETEDLFVGKNTAGQLLLGKEMTLTYHANTGTGSETKDTSVISGSAVTVLTAEEAGFENDSLPFISWNTAADGSGTTYDSADPDHNTITITENTTLYAQWAAASVTKNGKTTNYPTLQSALDNGDGGTVTLLTDIDTAAEAGSWPLTAADGKNITLDLAGFTIDRGLTESTESGNVITVNDTLTLIDSRPEAEHAGSSLPKGGVITGGNNWIGNGGVYAAEYGNFTMTGGTITGNTGRIGGGVYVDKHGSFTMSGGTISGNTAISGSGVYAAENVKFTMTGGSINNNLLTSNWFGGGIYLNEGSSFNLSGTPVIKDNANSNVYLGRNVKINVTGSLTSRASVGVTLESSGGVDVFTNSANTAYNDPSRFFSDDPALSVGKKSADDGDAPGQLYLGTAGYTVIYHANDGTGKTEEVKFAAGTESITLAASNLFEIDNQTIVAWTAEEDGSGDPYAPGTVEAPAALGFDEENKCDLYAQWKPAVAYVESTDANYTSLREAINAAAAGDTVRLLADINRTTEDSAEGQYDLVRINNKTITLDLDGWTIDAEGKSRVIRISGGAKVTLIDNEPGREHTPAVTYLDPISGDRVTVTGGVITGGTATNGGGVYVDSSSLSMSAGTIAGNTAGDSGGGVYVSDGSFNLSGSASVSGNTAANGSGGGVYVSDGSFNLSGSPEVSGNTRGSGTGAPEDNVYLPTGMTITLSDMLTRGASVGISMETPGIFTTGYSDHNTGAPSAYFSSDNTAYGVGLKQNSGKDEAALGYLVTYDGDLAEGESLIGEVPVDLDAYASGDTVYVIFPDPSLVKKAGNGTISFFTGWNDGTTTYTSGGTKTFEISANTTLKAKWVDTVTKFEMDGADAKYFFSLHEALAAAAAAEGEDKTITLLDNISAVTDHEAIRSLSVPAGLTLTLDLNGKIVDLEYNNLKSVFEVSGTLTLTGNGTIKNGAPNICVLDGGQFTMESGTLTKDEEWGYMGGGVSVNSGGEFTMNDGAVTGNTEGGVYVELGGKFTMSGGTISDNKHGGVDVRGSFAMSGGSISGNKDGTGGGVYVGNGADFTMSGSSVISGNEKKYAEGSSGMGGGVYIDAGGSFTMENGTISSNTAAAAGGGVYNKGTFTMKDGTITLNNAAYENLGSGGGVYNEGTFAMSGGTITKNTANVFGGGVLCFGDFEIKGNPTISGNVNGGTISGGALSGGNPDNVYLPDADGLDPILIRDTLSNTAFIAVTLESGTGVFTSGLKGRGGDFNFGSDNSAYTVGLTAAGEAILGYKVTYDGSGNTGGTVPAAAVGDQNYPVIVAPSDTFTKTGYTFTNWNTEQTPGDTKPGKSYKEGDPIFPTGDMTLYAQWTALDYSIDVVITGEGTVDILVSKSEYAQYGNTIRLIVEPEEGYMLGSLTYTPEGGKAVDITGPRQFLMPAANVTVNAEFTEEDRSEPDPHHGGDFSLFRLDAVNELPKTGFSAVSPQLLPEKPLDLNYKPLRQTLEIPSASVNAEIVAVPFADGEYPVTWLGGDAGLLEGSAMPGKGQSVLTGHNHLNMSEAGPFAGLKWVREGDRIFIRDERGGMQIFVVYASEKIAENDIDAVNRLISADWQSLTIITCEDERPDGGYASRRVIAAKPL